MSKIRSARREFLLAVSTISASLLFFPGTSTAQQYRLQPGDVLNFSILGKTGVQQRVPVGLDGKVHVPVGGEFTASGRTVDEIRNDIVGALKNASFPIGVDDQGRTTWDAVYPETVVLDIAEYQPVYVSGDVVTPGQQVFRPGMTVRQAAAMAGGFSPFRNRQDYSVESIGVEADYQDALAQNVRVQFQALRLRAELAGDAPPDFSSVSAPDLPTGSRQKLEETELAQFKARVADRDRQRATINEGLKSVESRRALLSKSQANLEGETRVYASELKRVEALFAKGLIQVTRLDDAQRSLFLVATRSLETSAEVERLSRELVDLRRLLERVDTDSRMKNLEELQKTTLLISDTAAKLDTARQRLAFFMPRADTPAIAIVRQDGDRFREIEATEDTKLLPGDTVKATFAARASGSQNLSAAPVEKSTLSSMAEHPLSANR